MSCPLVQAGSYLENSVHRRREVNSISISLAFIEQVKLHNSIISLSNSELHKVSKCAHYIMMDFSKHANKPTMAHKRWNFFIIQVFWDVTLCRWPHWHNVRSQKTWIFSNITEGTSNLTWNFLTRCVFTNCLSLGSGPLKSRIKFMWQFWFLWIVCPMDLQPTVGVIALSYFSQLRVVPLNLLQ